MKRQNAQAENCEIGKTENETGFPFILQEPESSAVGSDESFLFAV